MDFRSINKFNFIMNTISGNFFPMSGEKTNLGFVRTTYLIFTWIIEAIYICSTTIGLLFYVPALVAVRDGGISCIVSLEIIILVPYLNSRHDRLRNMIKKMNKILINSDELRRCIRDSVEPHKERFKICTVATISSVVIWTALPMLKILKRDRSFFTYTDFKIPTYYPGAPFTSDIFVWGIILEMIGAVYCIFKKSGIDNYISYLITLLTAEYRYVHDQIIEALSQVNSEKTEELVIASLRKCIQHHCIVIEVGQLLTELLSLNISLIYFTCILRFCFAGFSIILARDIQDKILYVMYTMGSMIQVYMFCLCVQELLEASASVTDDAFHENWYDRGSTVKNIFRTMGIGNKVKCRLTAFRIFELTVPTFASIVNQAYSVCLLLLRFY